MWRHSTVFNPDDPHPVRADNEGEGGIITLITLIRRQGVKGGARTKLALAANPTCKGARNGAFVAAFTPCSDLLS